jgi:hypothetical protein
MAEEDGDLQVEVERLRAQNAALERRASVRRSARRASVVTLLIVGCLLALLSVVAIWLRVTLLNTDNYVKTVAPLAAQPSVQNAVATKLNGAIDAKVDFQGLIKQALPDQADLLAPALAGGLESAIHSRVVDFTHSPKFQELWTNANRTAHQRVVALLTGGRSKRLLLQGDTVYLDLSPAVDTVKTKLDQRGFTRLADAIPPSVDGRIPVFQSSGITSAQKAIKLLKGAAIVLPLLALACLIGSAALTKPWRRGLLHAAIGLVVTMVVLIGLLAVGRSYYLGAIPPSVLPRDAASTIFDFTAKFLRHGVRIVAIVGLAVAVVAFIAGLPLKSYAQSGWRHVAGSAAHLWIAAHARELMIGIGAAGALVLMVHSPLTGSFVLLVLIIAGLLIGAVAAMSAAVPASAAVAESREPVPH